MSTFKNALDAVKQYSIVVADTGDARLITKYNPEDATTNPSLILNAMNSGASEDIVNATIQSVKQRMPSVNQDILEAEVADELAVAFGCELLKSIPGVVSTEVDARLSFDKNATVEKAKKLIVAYERRGIPRDRVLIKVAGTWEGCQAAAALQKEGINCNITLIFSLAQAIAAADAGAFLISPFVGRILDWHRKFAPDALSSNIEHHPGVKSVRQIFNYYKKFGYSTVVMAASFRSKEEIMALAGCDRLTISPKLMDELLTSSPNQTILQQRLSPQEADKLDLSKIQMDEQTFRWMLNEDQMATEKLSEGIRAFHSDYIKLVGAIREFMKSRKGFEL